MGKINWGIIGCGNVTEVKSGPAFSKVQDSELVAVMRRNADKAKDYAARHGVPKWYSDASQLIEDPEVNAVYVATPPSSHEEYAIAALNAGKPVYLEKPMAMNADAAARIAAVAESRNVKLSIAHYRRHLPLFLKIKELLDQGVIGKIRFVHLKYQQPVDAAGFSPGLHNWRLDPATSGGGIFHDLAPHQLDLMYYFFGTPLETKGIALNNGGYYQADDMVNALIRFDRGIVFNGLWSFVVPESEAIDSCEIIGSDGSIKFSIFTMINLSLTISGKRENISFDPIEHVQQPMIREVVQYFSGNRNNPCSGSDGVVVMKMITAITGNY